MSKTTPKAAIAATLGWSTQELSEYRYHYGHTKRPLYLIEEHYYMASPTRPTPEDCDGSEYTWEPHPDQFWGKQAGTIIWQAFGGISDEEQRRSAGKSTPSPDLKPSGKDPWEL